MRRSRRKTCSCAAYFKTAVRSCQTSCEVVTTAVRLGIPTPAFSAALAYYDGYRSEHLPANLLQAQPQLLFRRPHVQPHR